MKTKTAYQFKLADNKGGGIVLTFADYEQARKDIIKKFVGCELIKFEKVN